MRKSPRPPYWKPPKGWHAVQTYVPSMVYKALKQMALMNDRKLRAQTRLILTAAAESWLASRKSTKPTDSDRTDRD